jgi:hypothetical protein
VAFLDVGGVGAGPEHRMRLWHPVGLGVGGLEGEAVAGSVRSGRTSPPPDTGVAPSNSIASMRTWSWNQSRLA